jgi:hypothetical protein
VALVGELPTWLDVDSARTGAAVLAFVAIVLIVVVMFVVRSVLARVLAVLVLGGAVFGLLHYRSVLADCTKNGCPCTFLGEDLPGGGCTPTD